MKYKKLDLENEFLKKSKPDEKNKISKKGTNSLNKLSLFQKKDNKFSKKCPLSVKNAQ